MNIRDYVRMHDIEGNNEHFRKGIRSLLKLHPNVADELTSGRIKLIDAMLLAFMDHGHQLEWLPRVLNNDIKDLVWLIMKEPS